MADTLSVERRREVFAALVSAQDTGLDVATSCKRVALQFHLAVKQVEQIEKEGLGAKWPPLDA